MATSCQTKRARGDVDGAGGARNGAWVGDDSEAGALAGTRALARDGGRQERRAATGKQGASAVAIATEASGSGGTVR